MAEIQIRSEADIPRAAQYVKSLNPDSWVIHFDHDSEAVLLKRKVSNRNFQTIGRLRVFGDVEGHLNDAVDIAIRKALGWPTDSQSTSEVHKGEF